MATLALPLSSRDTGHRVVGTYGLVSPLVALGLGDF